MTICHQRDLRRHKKKVHIMSNGSVSLFSSFLLFYCFWEEARTYDFFFLSLTTINIFFFKFHFAIINSFFFFPVNR